MDIPASPPAYFPDEQSDSQPSDEPEASPQSPELEQPAWALHVLDEDNPAGNPPEYQAPPPTATKEYTFTQISADSMLLLPPPSESDTRPKYYISVQTNCFTPTAHITSIRRGGELGELVGDFEMGRTSNRKPATLFIRGKETKLSDVYKSSRGLHNWNHPEARLSWVEGLECAVCYLDGNLISTKRLAKFYYPPRSQKSKTRALRSPSQPERKPVTLHLFPKGESYFDMILISALVVERVRTGAARG